MGLNFVIIRPWTDMVQKEIDKKGVSIFGRGLCKVGPCNSILDFWFNFWYTGGSWVMPTGQLWAVRALEEK